MGLEDIVARRLGKKVIGFGNKNEEHEDLAREQLLYDATVEDVMEFGLIPELLGRLPVIGTLAQLDEAALVQVLTEPRNALIRQYKKLFDMEECELEFTEGALLAIARLARIRKTGARGLRSILEQVMFELMFELPELEGVREVVISEDVVRESSRPLYIYVKKEHVGKVDGIEVFVNEFTSDTAWGDEGYLTDKGMIPMPADERQQFADDAKAMKGLSSL